MATRTAPTVNGTPARYRVSIGSVDASGDVRTVSIDVLAADYTAAKVEALVAAEQDASQASIWNVEVSAVYAGDQDASNADTAQRNSVFDNVAIRAKAASTNLAYDGYILAPATAVMLADSDQVDPGSTELAAVFAAYLALKPTYTIRSARYNERVERNQAVKF